MMKRFLFLLFGVLLCTCVRAQTFEGSKGTAFYSGGVPSVAPYKGYGLAWVIDSARFYYWNDDLSEWRKMPTGTTNSGGATQAVSTDLTLRGDGTNDDELRVDTTIIATRARLDIQILAAGQREVELVAIGGETTIPVPFQVDESRPVLIQRNGVGLRIGSTAEVYLTGTTYVLNGVPLAAGERVKIFLYELQN